MRARSNKQQGNSKGKCWNKTRIPAFTTASQNCTARAVRQQQQKMNKLIQVGKHEVKLSLILDDVIL